MTPALRRGSQPCQCVYDVHGAKLIAVRAGRALVSPILPEAATILFGGGFPRLSGCAARCAAQRAIFHVQRELERLAIEDGSFGMILCDRGTPGRRLLLAGKPRREFWKDLGISKE